MLAVPAVFVLIRMCAGIDIRMPPSIDGLIEIGGSDQPITSQEPIIRNRDAVIHIECQASGTQPLRYRWMHNGRNIDFSDGAYFSQPEKGKIDITLVGRLAEGYFQCRVANNFGEAVSNAAYVRFADVQGYSEADKQLSEMHVVEGEPLVINCKPLKGYPALISRWQEAADDAERGGGTDLQLGNRISMDSEGNLRFAYVQKDDAKMKSDGHWIYKCNKRNTVKDFTIGGSYTRLFVDTPEDGVQDRQVTISYWSAGKEPTPSDNQVVIALEGDDLDLMCIFSGKPTPVNNDWRLTTGRTLPKDRAHYENDKQRLIIQRVQPSDADTYICVGNNKLGRAEKHIIIDVQARPVFKNAYTNRNATVGDDVIFSCGSEASPAAEVTWYRNGTELAPNDLPQRMRLSDDRTELTVERVCKNCSVGVRNSDLSVFQCNASNAHGYVYGNAYLNVLEKTVITKPENSHKDQNILISYTNSTLVGNFTLQCEGKSDDSTVVLYTWKYAGDDGKLIDLPWGPPAVVHNSQNSLIINLNSVPNDAREDYAGRYTCIVSNGYSEAEASTNVQVKKLGAQAAAMDSTLIIILVCVVILLALIAFCLCCCLWTHRNRGEEYPVDQIERKRGNDPVKELEENGYHEFQRPIFNTDTLKRSRAGFGSRASLSSKRTLDDEEGLLSDGYLGPGTFNEDGSFIGQYNTASRSKNY